MTDTENTQLTPAEGYNPKERMIFSEPIPGEIPDSKPKIEFKRINISTRNEDGSEGELIIPTERLYSFGVSENTSQETGKITGYTYPLCLWNRDGATRKEKTWTDTFNAIVDTCIDHLVENREEIDMFELTRADLTKSKGGLNPLYWKKEKFKDEKSGKTVLRKVPGRGPTLYAKLIYSKKNDKFLTQFFDLNDDPVEVRSLMGKHCYANGAVKIESIFIGARISLQVKLYEAVVEPSKMGMKRLLARPKARSKVLAAKAESKTAAAAMGDEDDEDSDAGSLVGSDDEDDAPRSKKTESSGKSVPKKTGVRRVKRVVKKAV
jgi:hypothetical protein